MNRTIIMTLLGLLLLVGERPEVQAQATGGDTSPLPIAEAIHQARAVSPSRRAAQARTDAAASAVFQASRFANPSLDLREENLGPNSGRHAPVDQTVDVFAVVTQPIDVSGKRTARTAAATSDQDVARAQLAQVERALTLETVRLYLAALRTHRLSVILLAQRDTLQAVIDVMSRRVAEGYAAEAELMRFRSEAALHDTLLVRARLEFQQHALALGTLLGGSEPIAGMRLLEPALLEPPPGVPEELVQQAIARRPEIIAARARLASAQHMVALERARRVPDIGLALGYKRAGGEDTVVTGFVVPLPVFDQNTGNVERALAEERAAHADLEALTKQLTTETVNVLHAAQELGARARTIDEQLLKPVLIVRNAAQTAFQEGTGTVLQLVDAERVYTEARREALTIKLDAYAAAFEARLLVNGEALP
jgi:cobalt-zinc-cadmium efflux system outer membrane protein